MKNTARHERYKNIQPIGAMAFCNTFGIVIFEPDDIDQWKDNCDLIAAWSSGGVTPSTTSTKSIIQSQAEATSAKVV